MFNFIIFTQLYKIIKKILSYFLNYVLPIRCPLCGEFILDKHSLCSECWRNLKFIVNPFCLKCGRQLPFVVEQDTTCLRCVKNKPRYNLARAVFLFDENSKYLIHQFKYYDKTVFAAIFAKMLYARYATEIDNCDIIIPVPMSKLKRLFRSYNQASLLAKELSSLCKKPVVSNVLYKSRWTKAQTSLTQKQRLKNLRRVFLVTKTNSIKGKKIVLIDDVSTTSSTINFCSKALKKHVKYILVLCVAFT